jgi:predicted AlkP superfamily phosphohydrolase/phosphomutase
VKRVYRRDELFSGACLAAAPDLCVQPAYGYDLKGAVNKRELMDRELFTGMHTQDDAVLFVASSENRLAGRRPHITDVAPTILRAMGLDPPKSMDGRSLYEST